MITGPRESWYRRHRLGIWFAGSYLVVAVLSNVAYMIDRHEYSIPLFVLVYASFPVYWIGTEVLKPQMAFMEQLPQGELIGFAILVGLTAWLYFGVGQGLAYIIKSGTRWLGRDSRSHD